MRINSNKILIIFVSLLFFNQITANYDNFIIAHSELDPSFHSWRIGNWNDNSLVYYYPVGNIQAKNGSTVWYNVTEFDNHNNTHPSIGFFSIGNLSTNSNNNEIGSNLAFSIWPWIPGLVTSNNWTWHKIESQRVSQDSFTKGNIEIEENSLFSFNEFTRNSIRFDYHQNSSLGNQNTTLIYDMDTGILLYGFTEIFFLNYYVLELSLSSSSLINTSNSVTTANFSFFSEFTFISIIILTLVLNDRKKIKK